MRVVVRNHLDDLTSDLRKIPVLLVQDGAKAVRSSATEGNKVAKGIAKRTAGKHGKHYPNSFTTEAKSALSWEYGPDAARPQGGMSFEFGSRNQPPHLDLAKSADIIAPKFGEAVGNVVDGLFWPGA